MWGSTGNRLKTAGVLPERVKELTSNMTEDGCMLKIEPLTGHRHNEQTNQFLYGIKVGDVHPSLVQHLMGPDIGKATSPTEVGHEMAAKLAGAPSAQWWLD